MSSSQSKHENRAAQLVVAFLNVLTAESRYFITQLPKSGALTSDQLAELHRITNHFFSRADNAETVTNSDDTQTGDVSFSSSTENRENVIVSDDTVAGETLLRTNPSIARKTSLSTSPFSGFDNAETVTNSDDTQMGDVSFSSSTENRENIIVSDNTFLGETLLQTNPSIARKTSLSTSPSVVGKTSGTSNRKRGRPPVSDTPHKIHTSSRQWGTILAKETFQLDDFLQQYLKENVDYNPTFFLGNTRFTLPAKSTYKDFLEFCTSVSEISTTEIKGRVRRLFLLIRAGEIALQHIGSNWSNEKSLVLKATTSDELDHTSFENLRKVLRLSDRLIFICECPEFGIGSILWLQNELSSDNLLQNRISKSGEAYESVIEHVRHRELVASIRESRADKLAGAIRDHLRKEYKVDSLGAADVDPEGGSELGGGAVASASGGE